ncbi:MAG TPA: cysteine--tRNA ligase [Candidatus Baltobacteraceae bacterium]|jgi:cysteinyl-tRNA synthetase|nr:cysteine--tRNA ligase [Candidatus Baltobacteraceae bacterium]
MPLKLYNTRTRRVEPFVPLDPPHVRVYVCGLTPSAQAHLGHARSFLFFDVLRRYLKHLGYDVTYVQNVTDIDDRSIRRARETGEDWYTIVSEYYASFKKSMERLGVREPDAEPYATKFIGPIIEMISQLLALGYAYVTQDGVYYRVSKFPRYGALANRNIEDLEAGARIEVDEHKDDPLDFALWKFAKPGEPKWDSPWGEGRPGWHIECSAMSRTLLDPPGRGFDIHGGGADLIFPHHENEVAQSEPLMEHPPMANVWMHGGLLQFDNRKMSKSLGNFEPLYELLDRHDAQAIRLLFLQTGYSKVMNFTEESVIAARVALDRLKRTYRQLRAQNSAQSSGEQGQLLPRIEAALNDDMNTAVALAELLSYSGTNLEEFAYALDILGLAPGDAWLHEPQAPLPQDFLERLAAALGGFSEPLALDGKTPQEALEHVIAVRGQARSNKDWAASDRLRDALLHSGVTLKDSKDGTAWTVTG